jgi:N-acetylglutamate synthase-like GNAT family acetyltransferase
MKFNRETKPESQTFQKSLVIYQNSFPKNERRETLQQSALLYNDSYNFFSIEENKKIIGLIAVWNLGNYLFVEHFAVREDLRNNGLGSKIIKKYLKNSDCPIVLETELPEAGDMAKRRIGFWRRCGFTLNEYKYLQPAYSPDKSPVPLFLMTYPRAISQTEFTKIRKNIYLEVYGVSHFQ